MAESGRRIPTWELTAAFVQSCGQDPANWRQLWEIARQSAPSQPRCEPAAAGAVDKGFQVLNADPLPAEPSLPAEPPLSASARLSETPPAGRGGPRWRREHLVAFYAMIAICVAAAAALPLSMWSGRTPAPNTATADQTGSVALARDGTDPYADGCKADEKAIALEPMAWRDGKSFGTLILFYSPSCQAAWGYVNGPNSPSWSVHIIAVRQSGNVNAPSQFSGQAELGSWGNVLSTGRGCVYIEAFVTSKSGPGPRARTPCFQGSGPVR
jgi:hypothetical protein